MQEHPDPSKYRGPRKINLTASSLGPQAQGRDRAFRPFLLVGRRIPEAPGEGAQSRAEPPGGPRSGAPGTGRRELEVARAVPQLRAVRAAAAGAAGLGPN